MSNPNENKPVIVIKRNRSVPVENVPVVNKSPEVERRAGVVSVVRKPPEVERRAGVISVARKSPEIERRVEVAPVVNKFPEIECRAEVSIRLNELPVVVDLMQKEILLQFKSEGFLVNARVKGKTWRKIVNTAAGYNEFLVIIKGNLGRRFQQGFEVVNTGCVIFEKKSKGQAADN